MQQIKETTTYRQALKHRILETSMAAFAERGIRAVKMDDIASRLGISKRTLYEVYDDKEQLLFEGVRKYDRLRKESMSEYARQAGVSVMDIILEAYRRHAETNRSVNPQFYIDIQKYPCIVRYLKEERERTRDEFMQFLCRGMSEGYFRRDIDFRLIAHLFEAIGSYTMGNAQLLHEYTFEQLFNGMLLVPLRGFCTEKGIEVLDRQLKLAE